MDACPAWASSEPRHPMNSNEACPVATLSPMATDPSSWSLPWTSLGSRASVSRQHLPTSPCWEWEVGRGRANSLQQDPDTSLLIQEKHRTNHPIRSSTLDGGRGHPFHTPTTLTALRLHSSRLWPREGPPGKAGKTQARPAKDCWEALPTFLVLEASH